MIKVIICDIDGTLLNSDEKIDPQTKVALLQAQAQGIRLVLASGRPTSGITYLADELELHKNHGLIVSYNGAMVLDAMTKETLFSQPLEHKDAKAILTHLKQFDVSPMYDDGTHLFTDNKDGYKVQLEAEACNLKLHEVNDLTDSLNTPVHKILVSATPDILQPLHEPMQGPFKDRLSCVFSAPFYFEFMDAGVNKGKSLHRSLSVLGYTSDDVIVFGDSYNDVTMFDYAGTSVAMGNAVDALKEKATHITRTNNESGIAYMLEKLGIIGPSQKVS